MWLSPGDALSAAQWPGCRSDVPRRHLPWPSWRSTVPFGYSVAG